MSEAAHGDAGHRHLLALIELPEGVRLRPWRESDFPAIRRLAVEEGWETPVKRPDASLAAWQKSWPALVLEYGGEVIGYLRALTDGQVTTYVAEVLVEAGWRGRGLGTQLIEACHMLVPETRIDLLASEDSADYYAAHGYRRFFGFRKNAPR